MTPKVLVGHDASGLELRMLAHYLNDPEYIEVVQDDPHTYHQKLLELDTRDQAKEFIYKFNYGGGALLIGMAVYKLEELKGLYKSNEINKSETQLKKMANKAGMINLGKKTFIPYHRDLAIFHVAGTRLKATFLSNNKGLENLIKRVQDSAKRGYLIGLDGRRITMRRDFSGKIMLHKALNTLMQSAGSVVMKCSTIILNQLILDNKLTSIKVLDMHDESQYECLPEEAERHGQLAIQSIRDAGIMLNLNCPLDAEYSIGRNWSETH